MRKISLCFAAGVFGGLLNSLALWGAGEMGLTAQMAVKMKPVLTMAWLYPRLVWGGIWGLLFVLPMGGNSIFMRGLIFSLGPSLAQLFYFFPQTPHGVAGLGLGNLTPVLVVAMNAIWGWAAAIWLSISHK